MKGIFTALIFFITANCFSQEPVQRHLFKLNIFTPGLSYELGLDDQLSLNIDALLSFYFHFASDNNNSGDEDFILGYPVGNATLQYYFNRKARDRRGRSLYKNSGMFIGPMFFVQGPDIINTNRDYVYLLRALGGGAVWGIQKTFKSNFNLALTLGLGYAAVEGSDELAGFVPLSKLTLGFVLFSKGREGDKEEERPKPPKHEMPEDRY